MKHACLKTLRRYRSKLSTFGFSNHTVKVRNFNGCVRMSLSKTEAKNYFVDALNQKMMLGRGENALYQLKELRQRYLRRDQDLLSILIDYRIAHLEFRTAKSICELESLKDFIDVAIEYSTNAALIIDFHLNLLRYAAYFRIQILTGNGEDKTREIFEHLVRLLRSSPSLLKDKTEALQSPILNLLELTTYFTGAEYDRLEGVHVDESFQPALNYNLKDPWRILLPDGLLDPIGYPKSLVEVEFGNVLTDYSPDFYFYLGGEGTLNLWNKNKNEIIPGRGLRNGDYIKIMYFLANYKSEGCLASYMQKYITKDHNGVLRSLAKKIGYQFYETNKAGTSTRYKLLDGLKVVGKIRQDMVCNFNAIQENRPRAGSYYRRQFS